VLLVGCRAPAQRGAREALEERGLAVRNAAGVVEALSELARDCPQVVVVDDVSTEEALDVVRRLREKSGEADIALIALSRFTTSDDLVAAGFDDVLPAQAEPSLLARVVEAHLPRAKSETPTSGVETSERLLDQLERQVLLSADLAQRCAMLAAQVAILSRISDAALKSDGICDLVRAGLLACEEAGGAFAVALYDATESGGIRLRNVTGDSRIAERELASFYGHASIVTDVMRTGRTRGFSSAEALGPREADLLARAAATSALVVPLVHLGTPLGAVAMLGAGRRLDTNEDWRAFAEGVCKQIAQSVALGRALTAREAAEREIEESRAQWQALFESAPDLVLRLGPDGVIDFANRTPPGMTTKEVVGACWYDLAQPTDREAMRHAVDAVFHSGQPVRLETLGLGAAGARLFYSCHVGPIRRGETITGAVVVARDTTQKRHTEAQLLAADRMASLGTLAAAVAHEINSPLASVVANLDLATEAALSLPDAERLTSELRDARVAAERVDAIVRHLKVFSSADADRTTPVDVRAVLESSLRVAGNEIRHRARLVCEYGPTPHVLANEARLGQVFLSLIVNAAQAIDEGNVDENEIRVSAATADDGGVVVRVKDTGRGIAPEIQPVLFLPFVSARQGDGTGLSLAIAQRVITALGGRIDWRTEVGRGTELIVWLPVAPAGAAAPVKAETPAAACRGRVLLVDDEPLIGRAVARTLRMHDVTATTSAHQALDLIARGERFDVIFCDLMMPQMTGMDFYDALAKIAPEQIEDVVFLSGGAFTTRARDFLARVKNERMDKPFDTAALRAVVAERLAKRKPTSP
jgi:PAS domain S-box-containing protein